MKYVSTASIVVVIAVLVSAWLTMSLSPTSAQEGVPPDKPGKPNVTPGDMGGVHILIIWQPQDDADTYEVLRRKSGIDPAGQFTSIASGLEGIHYRDEDVEKGITYLYRIRAHNEHGASKSSKFMKGNLKSVPSLNPPAPTRTPIPKLPPPESPTNEGKGDTSWDNWGVLKVDHKSHDAVSAYGVLRRDEVVYAGRRYSPPKDYFKFNANANHRYLIKLEPDDSIEPGIKSNRLLSMVWIGGVGTGDRAHNIRPSRDGKSNHHHLEFWSPKKTIIRIEITSLLSSMKTEFPDEYFGGYRLTVQNTTPMEPPPKAPADLFKVTLEPMTLCFFQFEFERKKDIMEAQTYQARVRLLEERNGHVVGGWEYLKEWYTIPKTAEETFTVSKHPHGPKTKFIRTAICGEKLDYRNSHLAHYEFQFRSVNMYGPGEWSDSVYKSREYDD